MHSERNDEVDARASALRLRGDLRPRCPQLRACRVERLYPVQGYCVLAESPGRFMIPSIEEYREYCTTLRWGDCRWFRGIGTEERTDTGEAHREDRRSESICAGPRTGCSRSRDSEDEAPAATPGMDTP